MSVKHIGVLTSGGDSPAMNAALRAVVRTCIHDGIEVCGIRRGFQGLVDGDVFVMNAGSVGDIIHKGGTILHSARCEGFKEDYEVRKKAYDTISRFHMDGIVVLGGDGSFRGAADMQRESEVAVVGVPCTIDNDLPYTDFTIGFDSAVNTCVESINKLRDTMHAHDRIAVVEVMGRGCGDIAVYAGIASGAEAILIPEQQRTEQQHLDYIMKKLNFSYSRGKRYGIILMAEGVSRDDGEPPYFTPDSIAKWLTGKKTDGGLTIDARGVVFGHVQRGGTPSATDRILASRLGEAAVMALVNGKKSSVVGIVHNTIVDYEISEALDMKRHANMDMIRLADILAM